MMTCTVPGIVDRFQTKMFLKKQTNKQYKKLIVTILRKSFL